MMLKFIILTILISPISHASTCEVADIFNADKAIELKNFIEDEVRLLAVTDKDVADATCIEKNTSSDIEIQSYLDSFGPEKVTRNIDGLKLTDHPIKIELLRKILHRPKDDKTSLQDTLNGDEETGLLPPTNLELAKSKKCKTVDCVTKTIFGKEVANNSLYMLDKYGLNINHNRHKKTVPWRKQELTNIHESISYVPKHFLPLDENTQLTRANPKIQSGNYANAQIHIYEATFKQSQEFQTYTLYHELGHNVANSLGITELKQWQNLSNWKPKLKGAHTTSHEHWSHEGHNHVSTYSKASPHEDFSETFSAYRFTPDRLKKLSPKKYDFMKKYVYQGLEYSKESQCQASQNKVLKLLKNKEANIPNQLKSLDGCKEYISSILKKETNKNLASKCVQRLKAENVISKSLSLKQKIIDKQERKSFFKISNSSVSNIDVNKEDINKVNTLLVEELMNNFLIKVSADDIAECDKEYRYNDFYDSIDKNISEKTFLKLKKEMLKKELKNVCIKMRSAKTFSCKSDSYSLDDKSIKKVAKKFCKDRSDFNINCADKDFSLTNEKDKEMSRIICTSKNIKPDFNLKCNSQLKKLFSELVNNKTTKDFEARKTDPARCYID